MAKHLTKKLQHGKKSKHSKTKISKNSRRQMKKRNLTKKMRGGVKNNVIVPPGREPTKAQRNALLRQALFGNQKVRENPIYSNEEDEDEEDEDEDGDEPQMSKHSKEKYFENPGEVMTTAGTQKRKLGSSRRSMFSQSHMSLPGAVGSSSNTEPVQTIHYNNNNNLPNPSSSNTNSASIASIANSGYGDIPEGAIEHIWFQHWPDHGVPSNENMPIFIEFMNYIISQFQSDIDKKEDSNTVIHCSAGVGRTGVVYVILCLIFQDKLVFNPPKENKINDEEQKEIVQKIYTKIFAAREFRRKMVQTYDQFVLICHLFGVETKNITLGKFNTEDNSFKKLSDKDKKVTMNKHNENRFNKDIMLKLGNETGENCTLQNRYGDILPYEDNIPYINKKEQPEFNHDYKGICNNYINASEMDLNDPNTPGVHLGIIAAQCPTQNTKLDFYKMLVNNETKRIIMVTGLVENGKRKCDDYFTTKQTTYTPQSKQWGEIRYLKI